MTSKTSQTRYLTACESCTRQYDVKGLAAGSRFHCACGSLVQVPKFRGHDASVVRCSACGAARTAGEQACGFCKADFTLHERDLHTICASCMSRISDRAKFCHHCGTEVRPVGDVGSQTDRRCPACGPQQTLRGRALGKEGLAFLECAKCAGIWLEQGTFETLAQQARSESAPAITSAAMPSADRTATTTQAGALYRRCPRCREMMNRVNFGKRSGVIIDVCREHGSWFDCHELDAILRWIRQDGESRAAERDARDQEIERKRKAFSAELAKTSTARGSTAAPKVSNDGGGMLADLLGFIFDVNRF